MRKVFTVKGYKLEGRSAGSFKLDLRYACKEVPLYSKKAGAPYVKNLGQLVFGIPDKWKGLFTMRIEKETETEAEISIYLDHRISMFMSELEDIKSLLKQGLETLKKDGIIKDYEEVK